MSNPLLTQNQISDFKERGFLILRGFYDKVSDISPIQKGIYDVINQVMVKNNVRSTRQPFAPESFDSGYLELIRNNRTWGGEIYDAVKQLPPLIRLVADSRHEQIFKQLREEAIPGIAAGGYGIRIDNPHEDKYRAMWHQEYPAQLRSIDGIVFWSSLVPITEEMGPLKICPCSHHAGPLPVLIADPDQSGRSGAYALALADEEQVLSRHPKEHLLTNPGDLIIIDFLLLHASGHNRSTRSRWSMQFRYFNFAEPIGRSHGWKGSFAAGIDFRSVHPDLCAK